VLEFLLLLAGLGVVAFCTSAYFVRMLDKNMKDMSNKERHR
jgi:hypothetical protein